MQSESNKANLVETAIKAFVATQTAILDLENKKRKQQVLAFNKAIVNIHEEKISIYNYIALFRDRVFSDVDITHMIYFLQLHKEHTLTDADDLGPRRFNVLALKGGNNNLTLDQLENLFNEYGFIEDEDYFKSSSTFKDRNPGSVYTLEPFALKTCLTYSKKIGHKYRNCYSFLETIIYAYNDYHYKYTTADKRDTIRRIDDHKARVAANIDVLTSLDNEIDE